MRRVFACWVLWAGVVSGCGSDSSSTEWSKDDAVNAYRLIAEQTLLASDEVDADTSGLNGSATVDCKDGGTQTATVTTTQEGTTDSTQSEALFEFDTCTVEGSTLQDQLTQDATASVDGDKRTTTNKIAGTVTFSGVIEGVCEIDVTITSTRVGSQAADSEISGSICGHPASDVYAAL